VQKRKSFIRKSYIQQPIEHEPVFLDWEKIAAKKEENNTHEIKKCVGDDPYGSYKPKTYILGVEVDVASAPIMHDTNFDIDEIIEKSRIEENIRLVEKKFNINIDKEKDDFLDKEKGRKAQIELMNEKRRLYEEQLLKQERDRVESEKQQLKIQEQLRIERINEEKRIRDEEILRQEREREASRQAQILQQRIKLQEIERQKQIQIERINEEKRIRDEEILRQEREKEVARQEYLFQEQLRLKEIENQKRIQIQRRAEEWKIREEGLMLQKRQQQEKREQEAQERFRIELIEREAREKKLSEQRFARENALLVEKENLKKEQDAWLQKELEEENRREAFLITEIKKSKIEDEENEKNSNLNLQKTNFTEKISSIADIFSFKKMFLQFDVAKNVVPFAIFAFVVLVIVGGVSFIGKGISIKGRVLGVSQDGYGNLTTAIENMKNQNFEGSAQQFALATENFSRASKDMEEVGGTLLNITRYIPFVSKLSSGENAVQAGKHFSLAGQSLNEIAKVFSKIKNPIGQTTQEDLSLLELFKDVQKNIVVVKAEMDIAQQNIDKISVDDLPEDKRDKFILLKQQLPELRNAMDMFLGNSDIFVDLLGGNGPRKYLFLFQNNSEMRATGGFVGSYGLLDISNGHVKKFFIDGIFNPDGQLQKRIVPPEPIQKISASWSMHDSNWFPDFPVSARKAIVFYEMTGGPTADGVIALTPTVMQKLLDITGPINMPEYDVVLDSKNFIELTQYKVEVDYDKEENKPKKILSDLAPLILEKLLNGKDPKMLASAAQAFLSGLQEKHILLYSQNSELEKVISKQGWSGEVLPAQKDYISVINTNINGFKTDAVVDEKIKHQAQIQEDGSIIDTVEISRHHNGGNSQYEWLNKVNADYMRVYVPEGSKLLEVSGQTRETVKAPLDYDALGFQRDADVVKQEKGIAIDQESGTRIYTENGKTVFGNWTYVSPQETVTIRYKYLLPFRIFQVTNSDGNQIDSYSLVAQKQSGSVGSEFFSEISYPENYEIKWIFPENLNKNIKSLIGQKSKLDVDRYEGVAFIKK
jgi:hypothetical protein